MTLSNFSDSLPAGWLAFELSILRRLQFRSVADPFAGEADTGAYLKRWGVRVAANDTARWAWTRAQSRVENNTERLSEMDVQAVLDDAYVPRHRLYNPSLRRWFGETDAWWFDNVRASAEKLDSPTKRALALDLGMSVGDYALSFDEQTRELRQPLSRVFQRLWDAGVAPFNNRQTNTSSNKDAREFLAREHAELLFLRLPRPSRRPARHAAWAWREEWVRGGDDFWDDFERGREGRLGARSEARSQYLRHVEDILEAAAHIPAWAVAHCDDGFLPTEELVETIRRLRRVGTIYTKDFTELTGARAVIITA
jgi:Asp-tRNA(Asn)/Glu-tRNA(Gln) amidotransferase A subunit family amidase